MNIDLIKKKMDEAHYIYDETLATVLAVATVAVVVVMACLWAACCLMA